MFIAIDIGATNIRVAEFDALDNPQLLDFKSKKTSPDYKTSLETIKNTIGSKKVERIGVGAPKFINLPGWQNHDLKQDLENLFKCQVTLAHDVAAAASGEDHYGDSKTLDFLLVSWGTGIGGAFVHKGIVSPTELGHQIIVANGKLCACGQKGCLEAYCGGIYLQSDDLLPGIVPYFAQGLVNCVAINPVPLIVFAGGLAVHQPQIVEQIAKMGQSMMHISPFPAVKMATHLDKAGIYGALSLLKSIL